MKNKEINENNRYGYNQEIGKRSQLEKELNIQRNQKNKNKGPKLSDMKMNQLNYYNEIAKNNIHNLMNNPTLKDIIRITSNESIFDQLESKEQSKDINLSKFLEVMPLKRVERINYKCLEIGHMRKDLGLIRNPKPNYNKDKCKKLAGNLFEKRKRKGSVNYIPVLTLDNLSTYNEKFRKIKNQENSGNLEGEYAKNLLVTSNGETWVKKYKNNTHSANKTIFKNKNIKENIVQNNKYDKEKINIKKNKENNFNDNNNLDTARIYVNKNKKIFNNENNIEKENKKEEPLFNNNINNDINTHTHNHKRSFINTFSLNKFKLDEKEEIKDIKENKEKEVNIKHENNKINLFSKDFSDNLSMSEDLKQNKKVINVKRAFGKNNEKGKINVRKNEELLNKNNETKYLNKNKGNHSQPFIRFKVSKN